jgi:hypothetical protein
MPEHLPKPFTPRRGPHRGPQSLLRAMTTHAAATSHRGITLTTPLRAGRGDDKASATPTEALASFIAVGRRDTLIAELDRQWPALGRAAVEDAVDYAIAEAAEAMQATREQAVYHYLRTAAHRRLAGRKERQGRVSAPIASDVDFDRVVVVQAVAGSSPVAHP